MNNHPFVLRIFELVIFKRMEQHFFLVNNKIQAVHEPMNFLLFERFEIFSRYDKILMNFEFAHASCMKVWMQMQRNFSRRRTNYFNLDRLCNEKITVRLRVKNFFVKMIDTLKKFLSGNFLVSFGYANINS